MPSIMLMVMEQLKKIQNKQKHIVFDFVNDSKKSQSTSTSCIVVDVYD